MANIGINPKNAAENNDNRLPVGKRKIEIKYAATRVCKLKG